MISTFPSHASALDTSIKNMHWNNIADNLNTRGFSIIRNVLPPEICSELIALYQHPEQYRSIINMQRYRFGQGEYKYFSYPLPSYVQSLRESFYPPLASIANEWMGNLNIDTLFPEQHRNLINQCREHDQLRPTPLILRYERGGFNTLHQDLYGEIYFPFQIVFVLTQPGQDHEGGEFVLTEQIPRAQSRVCVLQPNQGDAVVFTTNFRPVKGSKGYYRAKMKHGVSEIKSGIRYSLGIIFHDAK
ncbi:2OG-Fe(II) oxygenase [Chryseolinea sp. H1M3-3]|uniref:2OG-Fe(II) oxygenase n=1 Tax=Chryseolinea sp. H1M3-3 TaxID=3034144 RepID=UPI0023EB756E|nr:2OG-Fe(II) oxygenase [Chryseolinea sp. H1M3-3]